jgi:hypothetical protein
MAFWENEDSDKAVVSAINNILSLSFLNDKYKDQNININLKIRI